jgi:hypothetical protein
MAGERTQLVGWAVIAEEEFHRAISLERKRTERTRKPFLLMLLDTGDRSPSEKNRKLLEQSLAALAGSFRDTDVAGWYKNNSILGVICTEFKPNDYNKFAGTMMTRVSETLRGNLSDQQFSQMSISFHLFPEEWNHDIPQRPTDPNAPIYAPRKPRPHLRSGGATAVPEPDDAEVSANNSFIRVARSSSEDSSAPESNLGRVS